MYTPAEFIVPSRVTRDDLQKLGQTGKEAMRRIGQGEAVADSLIQLARVSYLGAVLAESGLEPFSEGAEMKVALKMSDWELLQEIRGEIATRSVIARIASWGRATL